MTVPGDDKSSVSVAIAVLSPSPLVSSPPDDTPITTAPAGDRLDLAGVRLVGVFRVERQAAAASLSAAPSVASAAAVTAAAAAAAWGVDVAVFAPLLPSETSTAPLVSAAATVTAVLPLPSPACAAAVTAAAVLRLPRFPDVLLPVAAAAAAGGVEAEAAPVPEEEEEPSG